MQIYKNFLPKSLQDDLFTIVTSEKLFDWYFGESVSGYNQVEYPEFSGLQYGFSHSIYDKNGESSSPHFKSFTPIIYFIEEKCDIAVTELIRIRVGMNTRVDNEKNVGHLPHIDYNFPHKTLLYYINDSDGETIIYEEKYEEKIIPQTYTVLNQINPEKGKAVLFDGLQYHSSSSPRKNTRRLAVNINFI